MSQLRPGPAHTAEDTPLVGGIDTGPESPKLPNHPPFYFMVHPKRWTIMGGQIIPSPAKLKLKGGVQRVRQDRQGRYHAGDAKGDFEEKGWQVLPWDVQGEGTNYLRRVTGTDCWLSKFEIAYPGSATIGTDQDAYVAFWRDLIDRGVIAPPALHVLQEMRERLAERHAKTADKAVTVPSLRARANAFEQQLAALDAAIEDALAELEPAKSEAAKVPIAPKPEVANEPSKPAKKPRSKAAKKKEA